MYTKISDYVTCYNPYCIAIHIAYDTVLYHRLIFFNYKIYKSMIRVLIQIYAITHRFIIVYENTNNRY